MTNAALGVQHCLAHSVSAEHPFLAQAMQELETNFDCCCGTAGKVGSILQMYGPVLGKAMQRAVEPTMRVQCQVRVAKIILLCSSVW